MVPGLLLFQHRRKKDFGYNANRYTRLLQPLQKLFNARNLYWYLERKQAIDPEYRF